MWYGVLLETELLFLNNSSYVQGANITVHKSHLLIGCACAQQEVLMKPALVALYK